MLARSQRQSPHSAQMAGLAVLCVAAHLYALAHVVVVPHQRCAEHGEMVHVDGSEPADGVRIDATLLAAALALDSILPSWSKTEDEHDHCSAITKRRDRYAPCAEPVTDASECRTVHPAVRAPWHACDIYRTAPKTSPPTNV